MSVNLQYYYAGYDVNTGLCNACVTTTYEINMAGWVQIPEAGEYVGKYYNVEDQNWYLDPLFEQPWTDAPQW